MNNLIINLDDNSFSLSENGSHTVFNDNDYYKNFYETVKYFEKMKPFTKFNYKIIDGSKKPNEARITRILLNAFFNKVGTKKLIRKKIVSYKCCLNYDGNKTDMLENICKNLPKDSNIDTIVDVFGGSMVVSLGTPYSNVVYNDKNKVLFNLVNMFCSENPLDLHSKLVTIISENNLSSKEGFYKFRNANWQDFDKNNYKLLAVVLNSFRKMLRFNGDGKYNSTYGEGFNAKDIVSLYSYKNRVDTKNITFYNEDFSYLENVIDKNTFVYVDPPYFNTTSGTYGRNTKFIKMWSVDDEIRLYEFLEKLNKKGIKFMLSNILQNKHGIENPYLDKFIKDNDFRIVKCKVTEKKGRVDCLIMNY